MTNQQKLLRAIAKNPDATIRDLMKATDISSTSLVNYHVKQLIADGKIRKLQRYEVLK